MSESQKKQIITDTLIKVGLSFTDKGFYLLRDIIIGYLNYDFPLDAMQKDVFAIVGKKYGMDSKYVQKYVRVPIDTAMRYSDIDFLESYFGRLYKPDTGSVTPQAFIIRIVDDVTLQCEELCERGVSA